MYLPWPVGTKKRPASAWPAPKAAFTSAPTSNADGPMHGPSHAMISGASRARIDWAAALKALSKVVKTASRTPLEGKSAGAADPAKPRHPAWAAATNVPSRSVSSTGKQSATMMVQASWRCVVMQASAVRPFSVAAWSVSTSAPCTCCIKTGRVCISLCNSARLASTLLGASPTWSPRFMLSQGLADTPPLRVVKTARTLAGAGQSGISQSACKKISFHYAS